MKVVITSQGDTLDAAVDARFGRAAFFVLADPETGESTAHPNTQNLHAPQGAGIQAAQHVVALGADWLLTGHCGPKAFRVLTAAGVRIGLHASGTVADTLARFKEGGFQPAATADVEGHWA